MCARIIATGATGAQSQVDIDATDTVGDLYDRESIVLNTSVWEINATTGSWLFTVWWYIIYWSELWN